MNVITKDTTITRDPGCVVGQHVVGGGTYGMTEALDSGIQKAAQFMSDKLGCNVVIRFNSDRQSGGAYIRDTNETGLIGNASIGVCGVLTWSDCVGIGHIERAAAFRYLAHKTDGAPCDVLMFYAYINVRKPDNLYESRRTMLHNSESPRFDTPEQACAWLMEQVKSSAAVREYIKRCVSFKEGHIKNAYGKAVYVKIPGKKEARSRFISGEDVYMLPGKVTPAGPGGAAYQQPTLIDHRFTKDKNESKADQFDRLVALFKLRHCNSFDGKKPVFYSLTYTYGEED